MDLIDIGHKLGINSIEYYIIDALHDGKTRINFIDDFATIAPHLFITIRHRELEAEFNAVNSDNNPMYYVRNTNELLHYCSSHELYSCLDYMRDNKISIPFLRPNSKITVKDNALLVSRQLYRHFIDIKVEILEGFIKPGDITIRNSTTNRILNVKLGDHYTLKLELLDGFVFINTDKLLLLVNNQINEYQQKLKAHHDK